MNFSEPHDSKLIDYIEKTYGYDGFTKRGKIRADILKHIISTDIDDDIRKEAIDLGKLHINLRARRS
jgi:hypothetical protein